MNAKKIISLILFILFYSFCFCQEYWESIFEYEDNLKCIEQNSLGFLFIGTECGVYRSIDNGNNWEHVGLENISVYSMIINSNDDIFVGTGGYFNIYISEDHGENWIPIHENIAPNNVIALFINSEGNIFAGSGGDYGLLRSTDNGGNWELILSLSSCEAIYSICSNSEGILFAATTNFMGEGGVYRSLDQGDSWELIGLNYHFLSSLAVNSNDEIFAGGRGHYYQGIGGVYRSSDNGETWETLTNYFYVNDIALDSQNRIFIGCEYGAVWFSEDNGETWQFVESELMPEETEISFLTISDDDFVYAISYGGPTNNVYRSLESTSVDDYVVRANELPIKLCNYPNPFNPSTTISFELNTETSENTELVIYNLKGQKVKILFVTLSEVEGSNNHFSSPSSFDFAQDDRTGESHTGNKTYSVVWNGTDQNNQPVSSGVYFYKLKSGNIEISRKMLLLK
ncbi:MAG: hypothetical protein Q7J16_12560 [Candidatus Cloacimonadales bacterium]|nr:hypothetical protein [Candidatus Cloacimonadales bacterium]